MVRVCPAMAGERFIEALKKHKKILPSICQNQTEETMQMLSHPHQTLDAGLSSGLFP